MAVHQIRPDERAHGPELTHAPHELAAGQVHVVHRQHRDPLQLVRAVGAELVDPVVVRLADGQRELRIHVVAAEQGETGGGVVHRDVDALHLHAHHLGDRVVVAGDREVEPAGVEEP